jgi:Helitron helicase-like domain at N-terminus
MGWHPRIPYADPQQAQNEDGEGDRRKRVTQSEYFRYRLHLRQNKSNHIFTAGKLFQKYAVDGWATTEQWHLDWVQKNQTQLGADTYRSLTNALAVDPQMDAQNLGQRVILPSSFSGSSCYDFEQCI